MKTSLLPEMQRVKMTDKDGTEFVMEVDLRKGDDLTYVFLSDTHQAGASRLAQDAMHYLERLSQRLNLDQETTIFYRHIYHEQMGSTFGRFEVDWDNASGPSYKFQMLNNLEELQRISRIIKSSTRVSVQEAAQTA